MQKGLLSAAKSRALKTVPVDTPSQHLAPLQHAGAAVGGTGVVATGATAPGAAGNGHPGVRVAGRPSGDGECIQHHKGAPLRPTVAVYWHDGCVTSIFNVPWMSVKPKSGLQNLPTFSLLYNLK